MRRSSLQFNADTMAVLNNIGFLILDRRFADPAVTRFRNGCERLGNQLDVALRSKLDSHLAGR